MRYRQARLKESLQRLGSALYVNAPKWLRELAIE
jgi:hypothetical protein